jgi:hypothetical protein
VTFHLGRSKANLLKGEINRGGKVLEKVATMEEERVYID